MGWIDPQPSGRYKARFRLADGTTTSKTFDYQFEAEAWLNEADQRLTAAVGDAADRLPASPAPQIRRPPVATFQRRSPLLIEHAASWERRRAARNITAATRNGYSLAVRRIANSCLRDLRVDQIRQAHVETWLADLVDAGAGASTRRAHLKVLRMILVDALDNDLITRDPTMKIPLPKPGKTRYRVLDAAEEARLLLAAKADSRAGTFILAGLDAGLRWGEIAGLGFYSVECDERMLAIYQVLERETGLIRNFPKDHEPRRVPMTRRLTEALRPLARAAAERGGTGLLFRTSTGAPLDYWNWARDFWYPARAAANLTDPQPRFHDLRHTYATRLQRANVPVREIGVVMGHSDETITSGYIHELDENARAAMIRTALAATY